MPCYGLNDLACSLQGTSNIQDILATPIDLALDDLLGIFKKLLIYEVAFLDGASFLESTHQCIFLWPASWATLEANPSFPSRCIQIYSQQTLKILFYIHRSILDADIHQGNKLLYPLHINQ